MPPKASAGQMDINVQLDEPLTTDSCVQIVTELLKYILYQKQQIPFTYESLIHLQSKVKHTNKNSAPIQALLDTLTSTSEQLSSQFHRNGSSIKEIAIIVGATVISPKFHISLELPSNILSSQEHFQCKHAPRKPLLNLMRSMVQCSEFQDAVTLPLGPTNTFVLIQKSDSSCISDFFLPKPQYSPSVHTSCFKIKFHHSDNTDCNCADLVKVYDEVREDQNNIKHLSITLDSSDMPAPIWYQSREIIKGFKYAR